MDKNYIVTKSNNLINCNYDLSLQEQKIILTLASMVQPQDENFKPYIFKIKDFMKLLGIDNKSKYTEIPKITKELMQKVFEIKKGNKVTQLAWLSSAEYEKGTGMVELEFSPKLKPYMLGLKEFYTSYKLDNVLSLKSKYSVRLYEILKSNLYRKYIEIEVEEFKNMVGSKEKAYNIYNNFKNRILIRAQKELIEKTDIKFDFEEIKTGRKVTSIKFIITSNKVSNEIAASLEKINPKLQQNMDDINRIKEIINEPIKDIDALKLFEIAKGDINIIKEKYSYSAAVPKIGNMVGWIIDAIKNDYKSPKGKVNKFNEYEQREYDFKELEKKLLGWK
ncbi:replication initiation protein (plasmid) [Clostridium estertheticum]|uniref:Replication initiation protein n=3 Tax=Clostridium estertheticum TaxID=238834 RepID=A0AA47I977_9CLOT|nr:replication initiation protein [Clostridium estertheticum]WAG63323.1 replication initiation protein [Clostridium estertheticum]WAG68228.1 replication initiation protein [Clostridium estertheticum]